MFWAPKSDVSFRLLYSNFSQNWSMSWVIKQKEESQNGGNKKPKHAKFFEKRTFLTSWYARALPPFWASPFCLITDDVKAKQENIFLILLETKFTKLKRLIWKPYEVHWCFTYLRHPLINLKWRFYVVARLQHFKGTHNHMPKYLQRAIKI